MPIDNDKNNDRKGQLKRLTYQLRDSLEHSSGIKIDSEETIRQALDVLLTEDDINIEQRVRDRCVVARI